MKTVMHKPIKAYGKHCDLAKINSRQTLESRWLDYKLLIVHQPLAPYVGSEPKAKRTHGQRTSWSPSPLVDVDDRFHAWQTEMEKKHEEYESRRLDDMLSMPFGSHIISYDSPRGFFVPKCIMYDESSDPFNFLMHFQQTMTLDIGNVFLVCKVFQSIFMV
ncbi:hypothetical protein AAG906_017632 [Vitis piasezkii]